MEKREHKRAQWFETVYDGGESEENVKPVGLIFDISEQGACIWLDYSKMQPKNDELSIRIRPPGGTSLIGYLDFPGEQVWKSNTKTKSYKKIGLRFKKMDRVQKENLAQMVKYFNRHKSQIGKLLETVTSSRKTEVVS